jgi:hypothetical protein
MAPRCTEKDECELKEKRKRKKKNGGSMRVYYLHQKCVLIIVAVV